MKEIEQAEKVVTERIKSLQKVRDRLGRARKQVESGKQTVLALESLAKDLRSLPADSEGPHLPGLADTVTEEARSRAEKAERSFVQDMRNACETAGVAFGRAGDGLTVGPFLLSPDWKKELGTLHYAKLDVERELPLVPAKGARPISSAERNFGLFS